MVDPKVPSFWPHNEVLFHTKFLLYIGKSVYLLFTPTIVIYDLLFCFQTWEAYKARLDAAEDEEH